MIKKMLILVLPLVLTFTMCKKEKNLTPLTTGKIPIDIGQIALTDPEFEALYDSVLMAAYWGLLDLSKSASFKSLVNTEVANEFDGDVNVLLKVLVANWSTLEADMTTSITAHYPNPALLTKFVDEAVNGFTYFDKFVYLQIYIPFDDQVTLTDNPALVLMLQDDEELPGHYINGSNALVSILTDENYAQENLVWVISVNETIDSETEYDNIDELDISTTLSTDTIPDTTVVSYTEGEQVEGLVLKISPQGKLYKAGRKVGILLKQFKPSVKKDGWAAGKDDVAWTGGQWDDNCTNNNTLFFKNFDALKFKKSGLNKFHNITFANQLADDLTSDRNYVEIVENSWCLIFEKDSRGDKKIDPPAFDGLGDCSEFFHFAASQTAYGDMNCHWGWWGSHHSTMTTRTIDCNLNSGSNILKFDVFKIN